MDKIINNFRNFLSNSGYERELQDFNELKQSGQIWTSIFSTLGMIAAFGQCNQSVTQFFIKRFKVVKKENLSPENISSRVDNASSKQFGKNNQIKSKATAKANKKQPLTNLANLMPKKLQPGFYSLYSNNPRIDFDVANSKVYQKFVDEDPEDVFRQQLRQEVEDCNGVKGLKIINLDEPHIAIPDADAIENQAQYYYEKYGIVIRMANNNTLPDVVKELNKKIKSPLYIGIIASRTNINTLRANHVTPALFYFPGNGNINEIEFISLDSVNNNQNAFDSLASECGIDTHYQTPIRQADQYSCHTDAIVILRNALLSLKHTGYTNGFSEVLKSATIEEDKIVAFPPDWDYTSQVTNILLKSEQNLQKNKKAARALFSKKNKADQTVEDHRNKNKKTQHYQAKIIFSYQPKFITAPPPDGVFYEKDDFGWIVRFTYEKEINTYLLSKGHKMKNFMEKD